MRNIVLKPIYNSDKNKEDESKTNYLPATKTDIKYVIDKLDELYNAHISGEFINTFENKPVLTPNLKLYSFSKYQKIRTITLLFSGIFAGALTSLSIIYWENKTILFLLLSLNFSALGTTISSFWALMKGKKYDERLDK